MERNNMQPTERSLTVLLGTRIDEVLRVVVHVGEDEFVLPDTLVLVLDRGLLQIVTDPSSKRVEQLKTADDVIVEGDYEDRTGVTLRRVGLAELPLQVSSAYLVYESI